jgi:hypothetical protein
MYKSGPATACRKLETPPPETFTCVLCTKLIITSTTTRATTTTTTTRAARLAINNQQ